jgi:glycine betaine/proline transport system substrate-binding protein
VKSGQLVDLGNPCDPSTQGWYVPKYVIDGDPARGIKPVAPKPKTVADLKQYWSVFKDPNGPSKGLFVNCIGAWQCAKVNDAKLHACGFDKCFNTQDPGTPSALDAAICGAYKKGQPILAYYWGPTWLLGKYDMVQLKEPPYTAARNGELQKVLSAAIPVGQTPASAGCAYQSCAIHKGANGKFPKPHPNVTALLEKMDVGTQNLDRTAAHMQLSHATADGGGARAVRGGCRCAVGSLTRERVGWPTRKRRPSQGGGHPNVAAPVPIR